MKDKKMWLIPIVVAMAVIFWPGRKKEEVAEVVVESEYPEGWAIVEEDPGFKIQQDEGEYRETVVVVRDKLLSEDFKKEIDRLVLGARAAIPSLVIETRSRVDEEDYYIEAIKGNYVNKGEKIVVLQKVLVKKEPVDEQSFDRAREVIVVTGSYMEREDESEEVGQVVERVVDKIKLGEI